MCIRDRDNRSEAEYIQGVKTMLENLKTMNFNTVYVHASAFTDAYYPSQYYPAAQYVAGQIGQNVNYEMCIRDSISDQDECPICQNENRNPRMICVVQSPKDVIAMEKMQEYAGVYHVLNGLISTSRGIMPEDLNIDALLERISPETEEVIIATNATIEGETTALYLSLIHI